MNTIVLQYYIKCTHLYTYCPILLVEKKQFSLNSMLLYSAEKNRVYMYIKL